MRTNAATVPETTGLNPCSLIFITQRFGQDKPILNSTAPGDGEIRKSRFTDREPTRALAVEVANAALFCYLQDRRGLF
jgi:hypothetical protein